jgi:DNA repair exonuclease SbcCD ATPase subunit
MIEFQHIRWMNFLSTGNVFTEMPLNLGQSILITGENGSGKSTLTDAICYALFGKPFRNINKPLLINSVNEKGLLVEIEFATNGKQYKIIRGMKPSVFEIYADGVLINQSSEAKDYQEYLEKNIIRVNYKTFTQIVILGSASFTPFMQLSAADRRIVIEDLLDIDVFSTMNAIVKSRSQVNREDIEKNSLSISLTTEKKKLLIKTLDSLKQSTTDKIAILKAHGRVQQKLLENLQKEYDELTRKREVYVKKSSGRAGAISDERVLNSRRSELKAHLERHRKDVNFFEAHDDCPTCRQKIDDKFKDDAVSLNRDQIKSIQDQINTLDQEIQTLTESIKTFDSFIKLTNDTDREIGIKKSEMNSSLKEIQKTVNEIKSLSDSDNILEDTKKDYDKVLEELRVLEDMKKSLLEKKVYYDTAITLLKDGGIKTKIIKQYLPIINKNINQYLTRFGFTTNFTINEKFDEVIKSRYRDEFSYNNFSEGEKARIDLSLLLTWRNIARMKNSVSTNLLILDEVFDGSMDFSGADDLMKILIDISGSTNVLVISHKTEQLPDQFGRVYKFFKKGNFSTCTFS